MKFCIANRTGGFANAWPRQKTRATRQINLHRKAIVVASVHKIQLKLNASERKSDQTMYLSAPMATKGKETCTLGNGLFRLAALSQTDAFHVHPTSTVYQPLGGEHCNYCTTNNFLGEEAVVFSTCSRRAFGQKTQMLIKFALNIQTEQTHYRSRIL